MSYGAKDSDQFQRAAIYMDKVLKGANPADLPVERPTKFELVINLKAAKAIGLTIPQTLILQADHVIGPLTTPERALAEPAAFVSPIVKVSGTTPLEEVGPCPRE